jgi:SAM-dependent methyltransferase
VSGKKLLDAGCGSGMFLQLARRESAQVAGIDAAQGLLDVARERVPDADLRAADLEELPFERHTFDVVTAFNALQYAADPRRALAELGRVCSKGGRVLVGQWADPARNQSEAVFVNLRKLAPPPPGTPAPLGLSGAGQLEALMVECGLRPIAWGEARAPFTYDSLEDAWRAQASAGPVVRVVQAVGEERARQTVIDSFRDGLQPDGSVRHENVFRWVVAEPV